MKNSKKIISLVITVMVLFAMVLAFSGCGNNTTQSTTSEKSEVSSQQQNEGEQTTTSQKPAKEKKITYLSPETDPSSIEVDNEIIKRFEAANPGIKVELTHGNLGDILPKLAAMINAGTAPDVAYFSPRYVTSLAAQGSLLKLDDLFAEMGDIPKKFVTPSKDGAVYDIPASMESMVLYYRKDLLEKAGITSITSFDDWKKAAKAMTVDSNGDNKPDIYGMAIIGGMPDNYFPFSNILWANGADYFDKDGNVTIDSPQAVEALKFWGEMAKYCPPGVTNTLTNDVGLQFAQGISAMVTWPGRIMTVIDRSNPDYSTKVDVMPIPVGPSGKEPIVKSTINDFVVFSNTKNPDVAKNFIKFYMSDDQYLLFLTASVPGHSLPVRTSWLDNQKYFDSPQISKWKDIVKKTMNLAFEYGTDFQFRNDGAINPNLGNALADPILNKEINRFLLGEITAEEALKNVADSWREKFNLK